MKNFKDISSEKDQLSYVKLIAMISCTILYAAHTCLVRLFHRTYDHAIPSSLIVCYQYVISILLLLPIVVFLIVKNRNSIGKFIEQSKLRFIAKSYFLRCTMIFCSAVTWFYALKNTPAVNCIALSCLTPILIMILAKITLGEQIAKHVWICGIVGLSGAIVILQPTFSNFNVFSLLALLTAFIWATNSVFTKKHLSKHNNPVTIFFVTAIILSLFGLPWILTQSNHLSQQQILFLIAITLVFDTANILLIWVFSKGGINVVAVFDFFRVVFTNIFSVLLLDERSSHSTVVGIMIILTANIILTLYEKNILVRSKKMIQ